MKKILLATTLLAGSAGFAAADITWAGSATAGIAQNGTANCAAVVPATVPPSTVCSDPNGTGLSDDAFHTYSSAGLDVTFSGATDGGLTFGATFDMTAGRSYTLADDDGFDDASGAFGMPEVWVEGTYGRLAFSSDEYDFYDDTNAGGDAEYTGTFGSFSVGLIADVDTNNASAKVGFTTGNLALSANADTYDLFNVEATYTMGVFAFTAATDESSNASLKVAYDSNGLSASAQYNTNAGDALADPSIDVAVGYEANGLKVEASADDVGQANSTTAVWTVTAEYDLGGGLSVEAGTNYTQDMMLGAKMSF